MRNIILLFLILVSIKTQESAPLDEERIDQMAQDMRKDQLNQNLEEEQQEIQDFQLFSYEPQVSDTEVFSSEGPFDPFSTFLITDFLTSMVGALEALEAESDQGFLAESSTFPSPSSVPLEDQDGSFFSPFMNFFPSMMGGDSEYVEVETKTINGKTETKITKSVTKNGVTTQTIETTNNDPKLSKDFALIEKEFPDVQWTQVFEEQQQQQQQQQEQQSEQQSDEQKQQKLEEELAQLELEIAAYKNDVQPINATLNNNKVLLDDQESVEAAEKENTQDYVISEQQQTTIKTQIIEKKSNFQLFFLLGCVGALSIGYLAFSLKKGKNLAKEM